MHRHTTEQNRHGLLLQCHLRLSLGKAAGSLRKRAHSSGQRHLGQDHARERDDMDLKKCEVPCREVCRWRHAVEESRELHVLLADSGHLAVVVVVVCLERAAGMAMNVVLTHLGQGAEC